MSNVFVKPKFEHTVVLEALLVREDVERYAVAFNMSFDEAVEVLGREYVSKYHQHCIVGGSSLSYVKDGVEA